LRYSVLIPAHRDDAYLLEAVRSVEVAMGDDDAELIVIANGPQREAIMARLAAEPVSPRRRVLACELPSLVHALNVGLEAARGEMIARMDADDICLPDRFKVQMAYMAKMPVHFLFSEAQYIDSEGKPLPVKRRFWLKHPDLDFPLFHPTALMRRQALVRLGGYGNLQFAEDRHLWLSARRNGFTFAKLPQATIQYRIHDNQLTAWRNKHATIAVSIGVDIGFGLRDGRPSLVLHGLFNFGVLVYNALKRNLGRLLAGRSAVQPALVLKPGEEAALGGGPVLERPDQLVPEVDGDGSDSDHVIEPDAGISKPVGARIRNRVKHVGG
jgi:glycosyltransferase involved in cell wall biosynthesis